MYFRLLCIYHDNKLQTNILELRFNEISLRAIRFFFRKMAKFDYNFCVQRLYELEWTKIKLTEFTVQTPKIKYEYEQFLT
jgi:hypothetical protein